MSDIREFVDVIIEAQTRAVSRQGFGTILVATPSVPVGFTERVRTYTDGDQMLDDGFLTTDDAYRAVQSAFSQSPRPALVRVGRVDLDNETWTEGLGAINDENGDWYGLVATTRAVADVLEIAAWVEASSSTKMYGTASSDPNALSASATTDVGYQLQQLGRRKTWVIFNEDPTTFPEAAAFGENLSANPGSITWQFKSMSGIVPSDGLSATQSENAQAKNYLLYQTAGGVAILINPKVSFGEWIDIIHGVDWLTARITESVFSLLVNSPKVPFTDAGITAVQGAVASQLTIATENDFLDEQQPYVITAPKARDIPAQDKAERRLTGVEFVGFLSGAIHFAGIRGAVRY